MKYAYEEKNFRADTLALIRVMNAIIGEYVAQGFTLTVRQLYYQLVARDIIPNTEKSYKKITGVVNDARLGGLMDWDAIEDRTRSFIRRSHWDSPGQIIRACADSYFEDTWDSQDTRVFVIVEKEALVGVLEGICHKLDLPLLAARGYPSGTVLRDFCLSDIVPALDHGQECVILHLGDHDPSGIDMTRDLEARIRLFAESDDIYLERIALNMDQIEEQRPPENPAKSTDSRFDGYRRKYGTSSWELDALKPTYLAGLIESQVENYRDESRWEVTMDDIIAKREQLKKVAREFDNG